MTEAPVELLDIPSMGGREIGAFLHEHSAEVDAPRAIVEIGTWLGAGTAHLARGAVGRKAAPAIHSYDVFYASASEVKRAHRQNIDLEVGGDTRPLVRTWLEPIGADLSLHKGDIMRATWEGPEIGLYVDDAAKTPTLFFHVLDTFGRHWVPGVTTVVLMDYGYWRKISNKRLRRRARVQQNFVESHPECFERIEDDRLVGSIAAFRYLQPLPFDAIRRQARFRRFLYKLPG